MTPRCKQLTERNGYYTGKRCTRNATTMLVFNEGTDNEDGRLCCTQHANKLIASTAHYNPPAVHPL